MFQRSSKFSLGFAKLIDLLHIYVSCLDSRDYWKRHETRLLCVEAEATLPITHAREMVVDRNWDRILALEEGFDGKCKYTAEQHADARPDQNVSIAG